MREALLFTKFQVMHEFDESRSFSDFQRLCSEFPERWTPVKQAVSLFKLGQYKLAYEVCKKGPELEHLEVDTLLNLERMRRLLLTHLGYHNEALSGLEKEFTPAQ